MRVTSRWWRRALSLGLPVILLVVTACTDNASRSNADAERSQAATSPTAVMSVVSDKLEALERLVPGGVVVVRLGAETHPLAFGQADTRARRPMRSDHRFQIGSITKTMVATLVLQLAADGYLALDDTVDALLPDLLPPGDRITVEHLLSHRSGLYNYTDTTEDLTRRWQPHDIVDIATRRALLFEPGTQSSYSNTNYVVLGLIVQQVTGRPVEQLLQTRVFDLAGMSATSLERGRTSEPPIAHGYDAGTDVTSADLSLAWTAGGVVSTAPDVTRFMEALFHDRLGSDLVTEMSTWRGQLEGSGPQYGLGLARIPISCGHAWGHDGEIAGFASQSWSLPDGTRSVVILVNEAGYDYAATGVIDAALCT